MRGEARERRNRWLVFGASLALLFSALALLLTNVLPTRKRVHDLEAANRRMEVEIQSLEVEKDRLELEAYGLEFDAQSQIRAYRDSFNTPLAGEKLYRFEDEERHDSLD